MPINPALAHLPAETINAIREAIGEIPFDGWNTDLLRRGGAGGFTVSVEGDTLVFANVGSGGWQVSVVGDTLTFTNREGN